MNTAAMKLAGIRALIFGASKCLILILGLSALANADGTDFASQHPSSLLITLSTDKVSYKLGSDILVTIEMKNTSAVPLQTNVLDAAIDFDVFITHGSIEMRPSPQAMRKFHTFVAPHRPYQIEPGAVVVDPGTNGKSSPISNWGLQIDEPGTYVITAISHATKHRSNPVTITVTP